MSAPEEPALLTDLCEICHTNKPNYRCPRCSMRTCSMTCSKRHKLWSQCSGVRDPAAYVKKSDLCTPAVIDKDFNFLVGLERQLERGERIAEERGIELRSSAGQRRNPVKGEVNYTQAIERCRVRVERAPKGMQRAKENRTAWNKRHKRLDWTVEWIDKQGQRELRDRVPEDISLQAAYASMSDMRHESKKRKVDEYILDLVPDNPKGGRTPKTDSEIHFYLVKPKTPSPVPVLIPLDSNRTLCDSLRDRSVLEFPTVYALPYTPEELPPKYQAEMTHVDGGELSIDELTPDASRSNWGSLEKTANMGEDEGNNAANALKGTAVVATPASPSQESQSMS